MAVRKVSQLSEFVQAEGPFHVGIDVHKKSYHVALRGRSGLTHTFVSPASPEALIETFHRLECCIEEVAYESGPTGFGLARALIKAGYKVVVAAPSRIPRPVTRRAKTDRLDCMDLARYAAMGMLQGIAIPEEEEELARSLARRRYDLAKSRRRVRQRIGSFLLCHGIQEPPGLSSWSQKAVSALKGLRVPKRGRATWASLLREHGFFQEEIRLIDEELEELAQEEAHKETVGHLRSMPGVGLITATTFRLELFRPERFKRSEEVTSYLGLAPMVRTTGEAKPRARLQPVGQGRLRSLLVEAAWIWRSHCTEARTIYNRVLARTGIAQKAICAVARKMAVILWRLCVEARPYQPRAAEA
jgi:transposase